jgi:hypothetical protein
MGKVERARLPFYCVGMLRLALPWGLAIFVYLLLFVRWARAVPIP